MAPRLPLIASPPTATSLRDRVLCQLNGQSRGLSFLDRERRRLALERLARERRP